MISKDVLESSFHAVLPDLAASDSDHVPYMPRKRQPYAHASRIRRPIFGFAARPVQKDEIAAVKEVRDAM